jgi:SAM-dependent methyltransferase
VDTAAPFEAEKIVFILRDRPARTDDNGVWVATTREHHESLRAELARSIGVLAEGGGAVMRDGDRSILLEVRVTDEHFARFATPKYAKRGRVQRLLIRRFVAGLEALLARGGSFASVLEIGCGEGFLCGYLAERNPEAAFVGIDTSDADLARLRRMFPRVDARAGSVYDLSSLGRRFDVVVCSEVLEHLDDPERALAQIASIGPRFAILSVPHEPWFRLGNALRLGDDPGHIHHFRPRTFRAIVERQFELVALERVFPWLLALVRPKA